MRMTKGNGLNLQTGGVINGNRVEIGACTCIDRGALDPTVIEDNVIIDNLCQIAHNVHIGFGTAVAGGVIMAGSLKVGRFCQIGGASVINGHRKSVMVPLPEWVWLCAQLQKKEFTHQVFHYKPIKNGENRSTCNEY